MKSHTFSLLAVAAAIAVSACDDLALAPDQIPHAVRVTPDTILVTENDPIEFTLGVFDRYGNQIDRLPAWAGTVWTASEAVVDLNSWTALAPGQTRMETTVAGKRARATLLVNPSSIGAEIVAAYAVQSIQRRDGSVPLVANRGAVLRIFAEIDNVGFFRPDVEVTFYLDGDEIGRLDADLASGFIPQEMGEGTLSGTWAVDIPSEWVRSGLSYRAEIDPNERLPLVSRDRTAYPADGSKAPLRVEAVPDFNMVFVPIRTHDGQTGGVNQSSSATHMNYLRDLFPIGDMSYEVREPLTVDASPTSREGWSDILLDLLLLRIADGDQRYYYGFVHQRSGGIVGMGYVGLPASIGWDDPRPGSSGLDAGIPRSATTFAHEIGHNLGLRHAPCGGPSSIDPAYPHVGGQIGHYGMRADDRRVVEREAHDIMGYCSNNWISDFTFLRTLEFRQTLENERLRWGMADTRETSRGLLVYGRVNSHGVALEPSLWVSDAWIPAANGGSNLTLEGTDRDGAVLFRREVTTFEIADAGEEAMFATVVPAGAFDETRLHRIRAVGGTGAPAARYTAVAPDGTLHQSLVRERALRLTQPHRGGAGRLEWDVERYPLVVVRDAETNRVIRFARNGSAELPAGVSSVVFEVSDGVQSVRLRESEVR